VRAHEERRVVAGESARVPDDRIRWA